MTRSFHHGTRWRIGCALVPLVATLWGCGPSCQQIIKDHQRFEARTQHSQGPHIALSVPMARISLPLQKQLVTLEPPSPKIAGLDTLTKSLGALRLVLNRLALAPMKENGVGIEAELSVRYGKETLADMKLAVALRYELDPQNKRLSLRLHADDIQKSVPVLMAGAKKKIQKLVKKQLGKAAKFGGKRLVRRAVDRVVSALMKQVVPLAQKQLMPHIAKLTRFDLALPDIPIAAVQIASTGANNQRLQVAIQTSLPVTDTLADTAPLSAKDERNAMILRLTGSTLAEIANWALRTGKVPSRFTATGKPTADGAFRPGMGWADDERPLKVLVWRTETPCCRIRLGAKPQLRLKAGKLTVGVENGVIEDVQGPAIVKLGAWLFTLWADAIRVTKDLAAKTEFSVLGQRIQVELHHAQLHGGDIVFGVTKPHNPPKRPDTRN